MVSEGADHLRADQLGTVDVTASTVANIGPGIDFYFAFGLIAVTAGVAAPLTILAAAAAAGVAVLLLFVYFLTTLSLPLFMWRRHRQSFSTLRHIVVPVLGATTLIVPFVELCKPWQPSPYSEFPYIALATLAVATVIAYFVVRRHPSTGSGEGTTLSEQ
jgi:hypothetical protein